MTTRSKPESPVWYLDSSVAMYIVLEQNEAATEWFATRQIAGDDFISSHLLSLELARTLRREEIEPSRSAKFLSRVRLSRIDNNLLDEAAEIRPHLKTLDAVHMATATHFGANVATIVTHDTNMARVAEELGFEVFDPIA